MLSSPPRIAIGRTWQTRLLRRPARSEQLGGKRRLAQSQEIPLRFHRSKGLWGTRHPGLQSNTVIRSQSDSQRVAGRVEGRMVQRGWKHLRNLGTTNGGELFRGGVVRNIYSTIATGGIKLSRQRSRFGFLRSSGIDPLARTKSQDEGGGPRLDDRS